MHIDKNILIAYGGVAKRFSKGDFIFEENDNPRFFHQIIEGKVCVYSSNAEGKELIHGVYSNDEGFGEAAVLSELPYPSTAEAKTDGVIIKITKDKLLNIFKDYPELPNQLLFDFAQFIYEKEKMMQVWVSHTPEDKIMRFIEQKFEITPEKETLIPYTRQAIANFTGLRVETVIRTLNRMKKEGKVRIENRKLYC